MQKCQWLIKTFFILIICIDSIFYINCQIDCSSINCISDGFSCTNKDTINICNPNCKPKFGDTANCYDCSAVTSDYYYINNDSPPACSSGCPVGTVKIIDETKECIVAPVTGLYLLGDFYYRNNCPENSISIGSSNECKCQNYYYIEEISGKKKYHCLAPNQLPADSNYNYYNYLTKEFVNMQCPGGMEKMKIEMINGRAVTRCSDKCIGEEFEREEGDPDNIYCVDSCEGASQKIYIEGTIKKCLDNCPDPEAPYEKGRYCVNLEECNFYKENKCLDSCKTEENGYIYHKINDKQCINVCPDTYKYKDEVNKICYDIDNCNFINENENKCLTSCEINEGFFVEDSKVCYSSCPSTKSFHNDDSNQCIENCNSGTNTKKYHNFDSNICVDNCISISNGKKYHKKDEFICYPSCKDIPGGIYIYEIEEGVCSDTDTGTGTSSCPYFITKEDGIKKCLTSANVCFNMGYKYLLGKECKKGIDIEGYFKVDAGIDPDNPLIEVVPDLDECFNSPHAAYYYNLDSKKCWTNIPNGYKIKESNDEKYEVVIQCPNFYYEKEEGKFYCTNTCKEKNKYFFNDEEKKCIDECKKTNSGGTDDYFYYDPSNNECIESCNGRTGHEFYYPITSSNHQKCLSECPPFKFYYNEDKKIIDSCNPDDFISSSNPKLCVERCETNEKVDNDKYCVLNCPNNYIIDTKTIGGAAIEIKKCVNECAGLSDGKNYLDLKTKECITEENCRTNYYKLNYFCYPKCNMNYYIDPDTYNCLPKCPDGLKAELIPDSSPYTYICKNSCPDGKYFLDDNCIPKCPIEYNYIGNNNKCVQTCESDLRGDYYYDIKDTSITEYKIYKCTISCNIDGVTTYYKIPGTKECLEKCPNGNKYIVENTNECLSKCPDDFPFYDISTIDSTNGHITCKNTPCSGSTPYFLDGNCKEKTDCKNANKIYINSKNICLDKCQEKFKIKNIVSGTFDGTYTCSNLNLCENFIIEDNDNVLECVSDCPKGKNFIGINNKCKDLCTKEDGLNYYKYKEITGTDSYPIYKCIDGCNDYYFLKIEGKQECFHSCPTLYPYISAEENLCYSTCLNSLTHPFTLNDGTNKKCVDKCNVNPYLNYGENKICIAGCDSFSDTKIIDHDGKCVSKCDKNSIYKYQDGNECKNNCGTSNKRYSKNNYICKPKCTGDDKYLTENGNECLSQCQPSEYKKIYSSDDSLTNTFEGEIRCLLNYGNFYYFEPDRILLEECEDLNGYNIEYTHECVIDCGIISKNEEKYHFYEYVAPPAGETVTFERNTCVKVCPNDKKYLREDNHCSTSCNLNFKYYIENEYKCLLDCPKGYNKNGFLCEPQCKGENEYLNGNLCVSICPPEKKYFIDTAIVKECLSDCTKESPYFYEEDLGDGSGNKRYRCKGNCLNSYIVDINPNINAKKCLSTSTCPDYSNGDNSKECYSECPPNKYIDEVNKKCLDECPFKYFHEKGFFQCKEAKDCQNKIADLETKLCVPNCETKYKSENKNPSDDSLIETICLKECNSNIYGIYSTPDNKCVNNCEDYSADLKADPPNGKCICKNFYYLDDNLEIKCINKCPINLPFIGKDSNCKVECEEEDGLNYYELEKNTDTETHTQYSIYKCIDNCKPPYHLKNLKTKECFSQCPTEYQYLSEEENTCFDFCRYTEANNIYTLSYEEGGITKSFCVNKCREPKPYYMEDNICYEDCTVDNFKIKDYDGKCVSKCNFEIKYKFEEENECKEQCSSTNPRYSVKDYKCKPKCEFIVFGNECRDSCENNQMFLMPIINSDDEETGEYKCEPSCGPNKYYYENEKKCLPNCNNGDYAIETLNICTRNCKSLTDKVYYFYESEGASDHYKVNTCVTKCPDNKPYAFGQYNETCVRICPESKKFFIDEIVHSTTDIQKICLPDCPKNYPFYTIFSSGSDKFYKCKSECNGYYILNSNPNQNAKLCLGSCPDTTGTYTDFLNYKYKIVNGTIKTCYATCPQEKPFYREESGSYCFQKCPEEYPFNEIGNVICKSEDECVGTFIDYDSKTCLSSTLTKCPNLKKFTTTITKNGQTKKICSNSCISIYGKYATPYNTCVQNCEPENPLFLNDEENKKCICKYLYYIDELSSEMNCFDASKSTCKQTDYKIKIYDSNQCVKICNDNRILSPSEDICYDSSYQCPENTYLTKINGKKKCECSHKFYYYNDQKICLNENSVCPVTYQKYVPATKQCLHNDDNCPTTHPWLFKNLCLDNCPKGSVENSSDKTCDCGDKFWYEVSYGNYECLPGLCLDKFPVYSDSTKQCLEKCKGSFYPILFENKCYTSCSSIPNTVKVETSSNLALYECKCQDPWYYNEGVMSCPTIGTIVKCSDYNLNKDYMISETKECVNSCPSKFPFYFNKICYESCEKANEKYRLNIENDNVSFECKCQNLWYYDSDDPEKIICYEKNINECPPIINEDHSVSSSYLIESTKECVDDISKCPTSTYKFNFICYNKCPDHTIDQIDHDINICLCNKDDGYWYEYQKYGNTYYKCGLEECPKLNPNNAEFNYPRMNLLKNEKKCVQSCKDDSSDPENNPYIYALRNICIKECPELSITEGDKCLFYDLDDEDNINSLEKLKNAANVQAKELYEQSSLLGGFLFNKFDSSLQIYAIDKSNSLKEVSLKSNLTYIDFGSCINKIYEDNELSENDKVLVAKYDLITRNNGNNNANGETEGGEGGADEDADEPEGNNPATENLQNKEKYLINQVEYELFSSKTNKKIDASVCGPYELLISYPIFFNKNRFNNYIGSSNQNEYKIKFDIGKNLHKKNPEIDTFHFNNSVYKDICFGVEIQGKDLVLEDRYKYLYPNNASLCESNCTINYTDYELERTVCSCTYKEVFDFNRKEEDRNDILNDQNFEFPKQSSANGQIIQCLTKISIVKNEAFYYCLAITVIEVSMVFVSVFYGVNYLSSNIVSLMKKANNNLDLFNNANKGDNKPKNDNDIIPTTQRPLNNPPKKISNDESDEENNVNIINNKNIEINNNKNFDSEQNKSKININGNLNFGLSKNIDNKVKSNFKAEYIPTSYNFKFFKLSDQGVKKKIERSKIPFEVEPDTKYLIERRQGIDYDDDYLNGPYLPNQNIVEIIDSRKNEDNKVIQYSRNELVKGNLNFSNNKLITKEENSEENIEKIQKSKTSKKINNIIDNNYIISNTGSEGDYITIKKIIPKIKYKKEYNTVLEEYKEEDDIKDGDNSTLLTLIKKEQTHLRIIFEKYKRKNHPNVLAIFLAEILDKIYFAKICLFLKQFEIFSIHLSIYLFCHLLLITILCGFFTISTIKKIWELTNYPNMSFYLLYGFISNIIVWAIYKIFLCLLDMQDKVRDLLLLKSDSKEKDINNEGNINEINNEKIQKGFNDIMKKMKIKIVILYAVIFPITILCSIYLVSFFGIYTGTKSKVFEAYYISIIEIILIKIIYGICLASLRIASEGNALKCLYKIVYVCDKYLS